MVDYYVWSSSAQDDSDATWNSSTLAYLNRQACLAAVPAGSNVWEAHDHSFSYSDNATYTNNGTIASPILLTCVNRTTGAIVNTGLETVNDIGDAIVFATVNIIYNGIIIRTKELTVNVTNSDVTMENCSIELDNVISSDYFPFHTDDTKILLVNTNLKFGHVSQRMGFGGGIVFDWRGGGVDSGGVAPTYLFDTMGTRGSKLTITGADLSHVATALFNLPTLISSGIHIIKLIGCKIPLAVPILSSSSFSVPHEVIARSCDNGDGYYFFEETYLEGQIVQDTANYLNATYDGTTGYSAKMASNANALDQKRPLRFMLSEFYSAANPTLTIEMITAGVTLQDDECWLEVEYPDETDEALRVIDSSSRQDVGWSGGSGPGTPSNLTASTAAWTEVLASEVKQKIAVTISGGAAGQHRIFVCLAKPSTTVYVDPKVTIS